MPEPSDWPAVILGDQLVPLLDVDRAGEGRVGDGLVLVEELLHADDQRHVVVAGGDHHAGLVERGAAAPAGVLDVDDRDLPQADRAEDHLAANRLLPRHRAGGAVAHVGGLDVGELDAGVLHGLEHRLAPELLQALVEVLAEAGHRDAGDDGVHAHVESSDLCVAKPCCTSVQRRSRALTGASTFEGSDENPRASLGPGFFRNSSLDHPRSGTSL